MIAGILLIPQVKERLNLSKKSVIIISIVLGIIGFICFAIEVPYGYVGKWDTSDKSYTIEFKDDNSFSLNYNNKDVEGTYTHEYKDNIYYITISTSDEEYDKKIYKYDSNESNSKELCLLFSISKLNKFFPIYCK